MRQARDPPAHEVVPLAGVFVPHSDVYKAASLIIQMEIKLFSPLRVQCFVYCLFKKKKSKMKKKQTTKNLIMPFVKKH